jgi:Na+-transporting NADH:ubiquinone oxidoreductase subunit D
MSEETVNKRAPKEPLFSKNNRKLITDPLTDNNPVTVQVLGVCSALAITVQVNQAIVMGLSVVFVTMMSNFVISAMRNIIPSRIRIIVQLVIVAALVIVVDQMLQAFLPDLSEKLSVFVGLIITNCILMGRLEAFAMANKPWPSLLDGLGNGLGYTGLLLIVAVFRELFGSGSLLGIPIFGSPIPTADSPLGTGLYAMGYMNNNLVILPPFALVVVGIIIWIQRARNKSLQETH